MTSFEIKRSKSCDSTVVCLDMNHELKMERNWTTWSPSDGGFLSCLLCLVERNSAWQKLGCVVCTVNRWRDARGVDSLNSAVATIVLLYLFLILFLVGLEKLFHLVRARSVLRVESFVKLLTVTLQSDQHPFGALDTHTQTHTWPTITMMG